MEWKSKVVSSFLSEYDWESVQRSEKDYYKSIRKMILDFAYSDLVVGDIRVPMLSLSESLFLELVQLMGIEVHIHKREYKRVYNTIHPRLPLEGTRDSDLESASRLLPST